MLKCCDPFFARKRSMAKIKISSTELVWIFHQRLEAFDDCPSEVPIAIVPDPDEGWMAVMSAQSRTHNPLCASALRLFRSNFERFTF
jgi:hypothetical protein